MRKVICLLLVLLFIISIINMAFAEPETQTVESAVYGEQTKDIEEGPESDVLAAELPKTGGIPPEAFYIVGALIIAVAVFLLVKKPKTASSKD